MFSLLKTKIAHALELYRLGDTIVDRFRLFLFIFLPFIRKCLCKAGFAWDREFSVRIKFRGIRQNLILYGVHDEITLLHEIFIKECYKTDYPSDPKIIIDAGANIGISSLYFYAVHPHAVIYAVEPDKRNFERLLKNVSGCGRIKAYSYAFSDNNEWRKFYIQNKKIISSSLVSRDLDQTETLVECMTLDSFTEREQIEVIDILKFDIEGSEYRMLAQARSLHATKSLIGEVHEDLMGRTLKEFYELITPLFGIKRHEPQKKYRDFFYAVRKKHD